MRLLLIEKKVAARFYTHDPCQEDHTHVDQHNRDTEAHAVEDTLDHQPGETSPLLAKTKSNDTSQSDLYYIPSENRSALYRAVPILHCFRSPSLVLAQVVALIQALLLAAFDATIPTHAYSLYKFSSLKSALLFIPLGVCNVIVGPLGGWAVDAYGTRPVAVIGYAYLVPVLALLRLPVSEPEPNQPILYGALLGLCGIGMAVIGAPSIVEAGAVVDKFHKRNPEIFGEQGPYAQLYAVNSLVFSAGLSLGPVLAGHLREWIGYGNMNAVLAAISGVTAASCYIWLGSQPRRRRIL